MVISTTITGTYLVYLTFTDKSKNSIMLGRLQASKDDTGGSTTDNVKYQGLGKQHTVVVRNKDAEYLQL